MHQCIRCIGSIGSIVYTGNIPPVKRINYIEKTQRGGGKFENRGFSCKFNYKVELLLTTWCFLLVCIVILLLALCWKHDLKNSFVRQTFKTKISWKIHRTQNVKFDTQIKHLIIFRYYFVSINTFWYIITDFFDY